MFMRNLSPRQIGIIKSLVFLAALLPFARLVLFTFTDQLGANPVEFITRSTGDWALYFLCLTLAVTPMRRLTGCNWLIKLRRMLGLYTFFYALWHFTAFLWFDHFFNLAEMWADIVDRPFITVGFISFVLLIPLAATSTNGMIKRIGAKRWSWLHRMIYLIGPLALLHFWWMKAGKQDFLEPIIFTSIVALLLAARLVHRRKIQTSSFKQPAPQK
jgi:sulfoxide reductase heme-binding subunit YedZ